MSGTSLLRLCERPKELLPMKEKFCGVVVEAEGEKEKQPEVS